MDCETRMLPGVTMLLNGLLHIRVWNQKQGWKKFLCFALKTQLVPMAGKRKIQKRR